MGEISSEQPVRPTVGRRGFLKGAGLAGAGVVADRIAQRLGIGQSSASHSPTSPVEALKPEQKAKPTPSIPEDHVEFNVALISQESADAISAMRVLHADFQFVQDRPKQTLGEWASKGERQYYKSEDLVVIYVGVDAVQRNVIFGTPYRDMTLDGMQLIYKKN